MRSLLRAQQVLEGKPSKINWGLYEASKKTWVQRDIEDQIREEKELLTKNRNNMSTEVTGGVEKVVDVQDVLGYLKLGYSRYKKDDLGHGSVQAHYGLTAAECKELFSHPLIKRIKTKVPTLRIVNSGEVASAPATALAQPAAPVAAPTPVVAETQAPAPTAVPEKDGLFS